MATRIGTITGIALVPGISRNGRLYTTEAIAKAVTRAQARIDDGEQPLTMLTHHEAGDDSTQIVGRITSITQDEAGAARYTADLADTAPARAIAALVDGADGPPFLSGVSIRGAWIGPVRRRTGPDGPVETADDLEIDGLDFTRRPGVPGARVDSYTPAVSIAAAESAPGRVLITESVLEALVDTTVTEADTAPAPQTPVPGGGPYADPGYQPDKKKRYDISTKAKAKAAWSYINQSDNARLYTSAQLKRIKERITKALRRFGVTVAAQEGWLIDPIGQVSEAVAEGLGYGDDPAHAGSMCISLTNGPTTVTVSSYCVDPHDLDAVGRAAMAGACQALAGLDPDMDADIDVPGAPAEDTDGDLEDVDDDAMESALTPQTSAPETPAAEPTQEKEPAMAESTPSPAAENPGTDTGVDALGVKIGQLTDALAGFITAMAPKPAAQESGPAEQVTEIPAAAEPVVAESEDERIARLVAEGIAAALPHAVQEHVEATGGPTRKGLVAPVHESAAATAPGLPEGVPAKPLHEYTEEEWRQHIAPITVGAILGNRGTPQPE
ncbi:DUF6582 domain-containing protein [Streptomyces mobaraensis]|uniref:Uncharacterized protein n=1 Tax=Streptomyces mobaraensis TaxID=35621 RepID=A0A5N5WEC5_STRMB|nr:DUF6582 domain-containing protein [Streptomyces mobaraensis]KAB7850129.1 hypothetical protein FRZ00_05880 [Streptomyces mobaraensis]